MQQNIITDEELSCVIHCGIVYSLVVICDDLSGDMSQEGLQHTLWKVLQEEKHGKKGSQGMHIAVDITPLLCWLQFFSDLYLFIY